MSRPIAESEEYIVALTSNGSQRHCTVRIVPPVSTVKTIQSRKRPLPPAQPTHSVPPFNPDTYGDLIPDFVPKPVCEICSLAFMTWAAFEYHVLRYHIQYRPYRCTGCKSLSFHTEPEARHHAGLFHNPTHAGFSVIKRTDFELENEWMHCLMNAKTTDEMGVSFSRERLDRGLQMLEKIQIPKFRGSRAQLPHCIRYETDPVNIEVQVDPPVEENAYEPVEPQFFEEQNVEYNYRDSDLLNQIS